MAYKKNDKSEENDSVRYNSELEETLESVDLPKIELSKDQLKIVKDYITQRRDEIAKLRTEILRDKEELIQRYGSK